jgi:hypothetical protein
MAASEPRRDESLGSGGTNEKGLPGLSTGQEKVTDAGGDDAGKDASVAEKQH